MDRTLEIELMEDLWNTFVFRAHRYDFHHTQSYHISETSSTSFKSKLFVFERGEDFIAIPLVFRPIEDTNLTDCTSVYGYPGPISNRPFSNISGTIVIAFQEALVDFLTKKDVVCAFSRLHPLIPSELVLENLGTIRELNRTISIDLTLSPEDQRKQYRKSNKSEINQLRKKKGYTVSTANFDTELEEFVKIYSETMDRVKATEYYYFDSEYFRNMLSAPDYDSRLLLAKKDGEIAAGAIFTITNGIMQYHLAGTKEEYVRDTPMKLLLDEARLLANELSLEFLHLGGGVGGSDEDSLFRFKSGFSKEFYRFRTWQFILNKEKYDELSAEHGNEDSDYFPKYRAPKN